MCPPEYYTLNTDIIIKKNQIMVMEIILSARYKNLF
jgi:hypothetical protein